MRMIKQGKHELVKVEMMYTKLHILQISKLERIKTDNFNSYD